VSRTTAPPRECAEPRGRARPGYPRAARLPGYAATVSPISPNVPAAGDESADLIVLGAGTAGLAAGWRAARRGLKVLILEGGERVGGLAGSFSVAGVAVDYGSHRIHAGMAPDLLADLQGLLGADLQERRRNGRVRVAERWVQMPAGTANLRRALPTAMVAGIARDHALSSFRRAADDSFAEVTRARLGNTVYEAVHGPYVQKLWGLPGERIAADQARRVVTADTPWKSVTRLAGGRSGIAGTGYHYPRRGFGQIADALAEGAVDAGATIRFRAEVDSVSPAFGSVVVTTRAGGTFTARHAFSTLPLPRLARITSPGPPLAAIEAATRLRFRAMVLVYLVHEGGRWSSWDTHYIPDPRTPVLRISEPPNYRDSADDPPSHTVLCAELPCTLFDPVWEAGDDELALLVEETIDRCGLPSVKRAEVVVHRASSFYPIYERGFDRDLEGLNAWLGGIPSVTSFGRFGLFFHDNVHQAMLIARDAAAALGDDGSFDRQRWEACRQANAAAGLT
jgi:protoporphyrinogen oxidase